MKLVCTLSMLIALAGASTVHAMAEGIIDFCNEDKDLPAATQRFDTLIMKKEVDKAERGRASLPPPPPRRQWACIAPQAVHLQCAMQID
ncbi:hypothetical protein [Sorangium sp. So ce1099]|uniref:hypothetical protein n=1 Tax=Sorangium sp. So ce1099 TaxID=3133331 RepID=UPI003F63B1EF